MANSTQSYFPNYRTSSLPIPFAKCVCTSSPLFPHLVIWWPATVSACVFSAVAESSLNFLMRIDLLSPPLSAGAKASLLYRWDQLSSCIMHTRERHFLTLQTPRDARIQPILSECTYRCKQLIIAVRTRSLGNHWVKHVLWKKHCRGLLKKYPYSFSPMFKFCLMSV